MQQRDTGGPLKSAVQEFPATIGAAVAVATAWVLGFDTPALWIAFFLSLVIGGYELGRSRRTIRLGHLVNLLAACLLVRLGWVLTNDFLTYGTLRQATFRGLVAATAVTGAGAWFANWRRRRVTSRTER